MVNNEFIISKHLSKGEKVLDVWFKSSENDVELLKRVVNHMPHLQKVNFYFDETINHVQMMIYQEIVNHLKSHVTVKLIFQSLHVQFEHVEAIIGKLINDYTINIYYYSKGALHIEFFGNDIVPFDNKHNRFLYEQLKSEFREARERPVMNDMRLKQELLTVKNDYDDLYQTYLATHKRMQYAFRELHKFKRSAWKYKKKYLDNEIFINNMERIAYYKKKVNKRNIYKLVKLMLKRVRVR
ncbi:hypothetical protein BU586_00170 [Staphylococcus agnetis]|uniref:hypothetical protein n=1 Tax=Staphylococcus agnetis TaxID=985762 RepID=UPI000D1AF0FD|nr:hypothetical protein [Staphylococcus agnetis]MCO4327188.1 hypothetical protein [Staphylococcus agnetis]MCO4358078.1 hypothetical protein [Staphylococcus agnetis]MCO4361572.1 hypothetical protein [Staphylococcus agnetis]MCO4369034.1 hypothetical protein [Staphylococcus agnetis]PTH35366.1 hypothetical protein BU589_01230 [Staphylococcus agnetis]